MITVTAYNTNNAFCQQITNLAELEPILQSKNTVWIQISEPETPEVMKQLAHSFNIHSLAVEDIATKTQRAKIEQYGDVFFVIAHELHDGYDVTCRQLCFFLAQNYVVSFQTEELTSIKQVNENINNNHGLIRSQGADYLAYALLDAVVDTYFPVLEELGERLDDLEDLIIANPSQLAMTKVHATKRELLTVRRASWPMREVLNALLRDGADRFNHEVKLHLRDCYDHAVEIIDLATMYREQAADLMDVYLSSISNRLNEIMKVLTIIATVFAPPTFIAAIYGMNFNSNISPYNMPETNWYYGYPIVLCVMFLTSCIVLAFLWWKGWLGAMAKRPNNH